MKICPVGAELSHVDGQRDRMKLIVAFCIFVNMPKKAEAVMKNFLEALYC
jgi:hypothetical protein